MTAYIDQATYDGLKRRDPEFKPYYINESDVIDMFGDKKQAQIFQIIDEKHVPVSGATARVPLDLATDDEMIKELNRQLDFDTTDKDLKDFLQDKKTGGKRKSKKSKKSKKTKKSKKSKTRKSSRKTNRRR